MSNVFCACAARIGAQGSRWGLKNLKWTIAAPVTGIKDRQAFITSKMFEHLSSICGLTFTQTNSLNEANLVYLSGRGVRADLDGPGGTLAYAYLPPNNNFQGQLNCIFDLDEMFNSWVPGSSMPTSQTINFWNVLYHETLHLLGRDHMQGSGYLMSPMYDRNIYVPTKIEEQQLVQQYGSPTVSTTPSVPGDVIEVTIKGTKWRGRVVWE